MKLSKKLITLLGASTLGFSALVPVVGANAEVSKNVTGNDPTTGEATGTLPATTAGGINDTTGSASAQTNAHVEIDGGYLILNQVPDFNFGKVQRGAKNAALVDNSNPDDIASDGNDTGTLQVTDYRDSPDNGLGYSVEASIGEFTQVGDPSVTMADAVMHLKATAGTTALDAATAPDATPSSTPADLTTGVGAPVLKLAPHLSYGITTVDFNKAATAATLDVPASVANGSYNAPITWTLKAAAPTN